jgi:hypothetical protein
MKERQLLKINHGIYTTKAQQNAITGKQKAKILAKSPFSIYRPEHL